MSEIWRPVEGYEGLYEISNRGRIRSCDKQVRHVSKKGKESTALVRGKILKTFIGTNGYPMITISKNGKVKSHMIHRLVGKQFIEKPTGATEINHKDANKTNNEVSNLEWVSSNENKKHIYGVGKRPTGKQHHFSRLSRDKKGHCKKMVESLYPITIEEV